jgi:hypothetical protein
MQRPLAAGRNKMAVKYVKDFDFSKGTAACNYAKGGSAKKPAGMMIVIGVGKPKGQMRKAEGGSISDSERLAQMAGDANAKTEAERIMGQKNPPKKSPPAKKGSPYIPGTNVKANDLYTKEELERLERGYKKGGMAKHPDEAMDKALIKKMVKPGVLKKADGGMAMGSMGKANPYAMGPGGRQYESAMDKQSNQMPVPQRGATGLGSLTAADASRLGNAVMAPKRGAPPAPMPVPQRGAASMRPASGPMPTPLRGAPPRPAPAPPAPMMGGSKSLKDPVSGRATGLGPLVQEPARPALAPPMRRAEGGMASIKSPLQRMSRAKGVPVASEMPMIESKSSGPKSIGVNAKRPGGPNVGKIRAAMARAASKAVPENAPSMMKKGGKVK